jgi:hypothetical protein
MASPVGVVLMFRVSPHLQSAQRGVINERAALPPDLLTGHPRCPALRGQRGSMSSSTLVSLLDDFSDPEGGAAWGSGISG